MVYSEEEAVSELISVIGRMLSFTQNVIYRCIFSVKDIKQDDRTKNQIEIKFRIYIHINIYKYILYLYTHKYTLTKEKKTHQQHHRKPSVKKTSLDNIALGTRKILL